MYVVMDRFATLFAWFAFLAGMVLLWRHMHKHKRPRKRVRFSETVSVRTYQRD